MKHGSIDAVFNRSLRLDSSEFLSLGLIPIRLRLEHGREQSAGSSVSDSERVLAARNVRP
jgi:hypothetical protein